VAMPCAARCGGRCLTSLCRLGSQTLCSIFATKLLLPLISLPVPYINYVGRDGCMLGLFLTPNDGRLHCSGQLQAVPLHGGMVWPQLPLDPAPPPSLRLGLGVLTVEASGRKPL
jgi:hypothetical protein